MKKINVLSLFDGIRCGMVALERAGVTVGKYYASEIDKYAIQVANKNYPNCINLGDVNNWQDWDIDWANIDLIIGGSPCQGFSLAGKQLNFNDERSKLFFVYADILKHVQAKNPQVKFLLENVKMKKEYQNVISDILGVEPILINSALVSAQNRERLYWTNLTNIKQPDDRHIYLKDIIEDGYVDQLKRFCLDANYFKGGSLKQYFEKSRRQLVFMDAVQLELLGIYNLPRGNNKGGFRNDGTKSPTLSSSKWEYNNLLGYFKKNQGQLVFETPLQVGIADIKGFDCIKRVYSELGKSPTLTTCGGGHREPKVAIGEAYWRKLTPIECERLQTLTDNYTEGVSNSQRYKMLGNGWTVDVIAHIFKGLLND